MTPRDLQFDRRKNPDSPRVHGLRIAVSGQSHAEQKQSQNGEGTLPSNAARMRKTFELPLGHAPTGATGERREPSSRLLTVEEVADLLRVPVSWVYGRMRKRSLERLPAYRLGKYWRFREEEVLAWIRTKAREARP